MEGQDWAVVTITACSVFLHFCFGWTPSSKWKYSALHYKGVLIHPKFSSHSISSPVAVSIYQSTAAVTSVCSEPTTLQGKPPCFIFILSPMKPREVSPRESSLSFLLRRGEGTAEAPAGAAVPVGGSALAQLPLPGRSQGCVCIQPRQGTLPSPQTPSWTPPAPLGHGQRELWELQHSSNETATPLISWGGRKGTSVLSTVAAGWHIPCYSILLALITQTFSI